MLAALLAGLTVCGCGSSYDNLAEGLPPPPANVSTDRELPRREWQPVVEAAPNHHAVPEYTSTLMFGQAVQRVVTYSPAIKAAFVEIQARRGEELQASVKPNPELKVDIEDFLGSSPYSGFQSSQETITVAQLIELGDKRVKRLRAARLDTTASEWDLETTRVQVIVQAAQYFVDVLASQERVTALRSTVALSEKTRTAVEKRIKVGNTSPIELDRTNVSTARARAALKVEEERLKASRLQLSALWGSPHTDFERAGGKLGNGTNMPPTERILAFVDNNPSVARWADEIGRRGAVLDVELAKSVRDYTIGGGVRRFEDTDSTALVVSVSTPLKLFDTNAGAITAAEQRIEKAEHERNAARVAVTGSVAEALSALAVAAARVRSLEREVLPAAESAYQKTQAGYEEARFDLLNVLDSQRTLTEVRLELVDAKADFERAKVRVEALIGRQLSEI